MAVLAAFVVFAAGCAAPNYNHRGYYPQNMAGVSSVRATPTYYDRAPAYNRSDKTAQAARDEREWIVNEQYEAQAEQQRAYAERERLRAQSDYVRENVRAVREATEAAREIRNLFRRSWW